MSYDKNPMKLADRTLRGFGATRAGRERDGIRYRMPNGAMELVPHDAPPWRVRELCDAWSKRYGGGLRPTHLRGNRVRPSDAPSVHTTKINLTRHAAERLELMAQQAGVTRGEVVHALTNPVAVHKTSTGWNWRGERVTVAASYTNGVLNITTILWSTEDLWEQHPRTADQ